MTTTYYVDRSQPTGHQIVAVPDRHRDRHFLPTGRSYDECVVALVDSGGILVPHRGSEETIEQYTARMRAEALARLAPTHSPEEIDR